MDPRVGNFAHTVGYLYNLLPTVFTNGTRGIANGTIGRTLNKFGIQGRRPDNFFDRKWFRPNTFWPFFDCSIFARSFFSGADLDFLMRLSKLE